MLFRIVLLVLLTRTACAASVEESLARLRTMTDGRIAFCKPSVMEELQIIGEPRKLSKDEVQRVGALLGSEESYFERLPDGTVKGLSSMCIPHWDFKLILFEAREGGSSCTIRLCTSCQQVSILLDGVGVGVPNIRSPAFLELAKLLDLWFPGWAKISSENKRKWEADIRDKRL